MAQLLRQVAAKEKKTMGRYFGTDGIRGKANEGLTAQRAFEVGRYLGWYRRSYRTACF